MRIQDANWIVARGADEKLVPMFRRTFTCGKEIERAWLEITAAGVYEATLNGQRVGNFILAPGWTQYEKRLQVQRYDITSMLAEENNLRVIVGNGWYRRLTPLAPPVPNAFTYLPAILIAHIHIQYADGSETVIVTDENWQTAPSNITLSGIFDGESVDARIESEVFEPAEVYDYTREMLVPQQGCEVVEQETIYPCASFLTPKGEWVLDFGQNLTGYMAFEFEAKSGERLVLSTAEVLDSEGNFYTENYRLARSRMEYTCKDGWQTYKPRLTFFGFRYLRIDEAPEGFSPENIRAVVLHSDMRRTGWLESSDPLLNQLFRNIIWGQKGNFLDVPTDCPQRDERLGWTGDAQVFVRTASYNYDVRQFFKKWLTDLKLAQREDGSVPSIIPDCLPKMFIGSGWGDVATICPWQLYTTYGDETFLSDQFNSMCRWVDYIGSVTTTPNLWTGGEQFGDWLGLDAEAGSYKGASSDDLVSSAFYARSTEIVVQAGHILGRDVKHYEELYDAAVAAFKATYCDKLNTQTEKVLALEFNLTDYPQEVADALAQQVIDCGTALQTGFVGTPYLLRVLSRYGYSDLAYSLLLRREYPSWLYSVTKGATTIWEHWDGIHEDGSFWSRDMNSFNHYAYGAVADWVYEYACGIQPAAPGFAKAIIAPHPDDRIPSLTAKIDTVHGEIYSSWYHIEGRVRYEIRTAVPAEIHIGDRVYHVEKGNYVF